MHGAGRLIVDRFMVSRSCTYRGQNGPSHFAYSTLNSTISIEYEQVSLLHISMSSNVENHTLQAAEPKNEPHDACRMMLEL